MDLFAESGVGGHIDNATQVWIFDLPSWGQCGQGTDESSAIDALASQLGESSSRFTIRERIFGDEQAFDRDRQPAQPEERESTRAILRTMRARTLEVLERCTPAQLDWVDPERHLPPWATWYTLEEMGWHIADTESRYYLTRLGLEPPRRRNNLIDELRESAAHVDRAITELPAELVVEANGEVWTTTKALRRLAWHERAELTVIHSLTTKAASALGLT